MKESLARWAIAMFTALLIGISFIMMILTAPSMLVGIQSMEPIELIIERTESDDGSESDNGAAAGLINLNTATIEQLMTLPSLGEVLADRIIAYREQQGGFAAVDDLLNVSGVGEKRLSLWLPYLTI